MSTCFFPTEDTIRAVTKISSCQLYAIISRKFFWFYFPFVSYESSWGDLMFMVAGGNPRPLALSDGPVNNG